MLSTQLRALQAKRKKKKTFSAFFLSSSGPPPKKRLWNPFWPPFEPTPRRPRKCPNTSGYIWSCCRAYVHRTRSLTSHTQFETATRQCNVQTWTSQPCVNDIIWRADTKQKLVPGATYLSSTRIQLASTNFAGFLLQHESWLGRSPDPG